MAVNRAIINIFDGYWRSNADLTNFNKKLRI